MTVENIQYRTPEIERFYRAHRTRWDHFYRSEHTIFERLDLDAGTSVLDVGCGCGGLGLALRERYGVERYTGIEINEAAAASGRALNPGARIVSGDVLAATEAELGAASFDVVVSLGCIDWNVRFRDMLHRAYALTRPGGHFVSSFRLTPEAGIDDIARSFQYINFDGTKSGEKAPYVVLNARALTATLLALQPQRLLAHGYWGAPSATAETPFERVCFAVIAVQRGEGGEPRTRVDLDLPHEIVRGVFDAPGVRQ